MDRRTIGLFVGCIMLVGCGQQPEIVYANWLRPPSEPGTLQGRYEAYARAADMASEASPKYLKTVYFTPGKRDLCLKQIGPALKVLGEGIRRPELGYSFVAQKPFVTPPRVAGWRLLGRGLVWKIEAAVAAEDFDSAVRCAVLATEFGFDLLGGGAMEASLGMGIADEARRAMAPALARMSSQQLDALASGIERALSRKPDLTVTIDNERENMLARVQALQDAYRSEEWKSLQAKMGPDIRSSIDHLKQIKQDDPRQAVDYFKSLADEGEVEARYVDSMATLPLSERKQINEPQHVGNRPWRKFAKHFFATLRPLLTQHDQCLARTNLFALEARLQRVSLAGRNYPKDLGQFSKTITRDPYSGEQFLYEADGGDCKLYSVGADLRDDGGQTDESFTSPDLRLELR